MMAAEESARFVRRAGVTVTPEVLEQLDADVKSLAVEYRRRPPYASFRPLAGLRRDVFDMIDRHPRPGHLVDLYRVASQLSALLAHASFSLGQPYAADSHARTALLCADLAGDETLRAYIRWLQSCVAYSRSDYQDATDLAQSGQRFAGQGNDLLRLTSHQEALELFTIPEGGHSLANVAIAQLDLVAAQLALHDLDGASVHAQAVLQLASEYRTAGIIRLIAKIDQTLAGEAFDKVTLASDLREQIAVFSAYPAARDLPPLTIS